jgi:FtsX-like permease family protein
MVRLGLRLSLRSGREGLTRLILTAAAVGIGIALLLSVFAEFHAFQVSNGRQCWECTARGGPGEGKPGAGRQSQSGPASDTVLWNYSADYFRGQTIERLDLAALGPHAPVPPGISRLPGAGQYYVSPALAALLRSVPRDQLGDRFPGSQVGTIGDKALSGPDELVIFVGYAPAKLAAIRHTERVTTITAGAGKQVWTPYFRYAFVVGVLAVLFPTLILIGTASRLSAARREERYAAMRLVGATPRQIAVIASVDAALAALLGTATGIGIFLAIQPALAGAALIGTRYFASTLTPTALGYVGMLVAVPAVSAVASLLALRRVQISPLGVSRKVSPPAPRIWRVVPLLLGIALFVAGLLITNQQSIGAPAYPGLLIIMIGLVVGGPWLTERAARLFAKVTNGASALLAARRLADNPKAAFRTVRGLVLAVFLGTVVAGLVPAVNATTATPSANALQNVLLDTFAGGPGAPGLAPSAGAQLVRELRAFRGATVFPLYAAPGTDSGFPGGGINGIISCASLRQLAVLGECAPGIKAVTADDGDLIFSDNPTFSTQPFVGRGTPAYSGSYRNLPLQAVLVRVNNPATLERVRTFLDTHTPPSGDVPPRTYGEAVQIRVAYASIVQRLVYIAVTLTLLVAGCSLAVVVGGGLMERKRPFTLMRVSGTPTATLYRVVILEAILPLAAATVVAAGTAYGISVLTVKKMAPAGTPIPVLGHVYYATMATGLVISLLVIAVTLPLLGRVTVPGNARFE